MNGIHVLIVEDNQLNFELVADLLEANGCTVLQAQSAEEGLELARAASPDLVLMDFSLPGMDGLCATRALKSDPRTCHLTVIAITAHAMKGDEEMARSAGCDGYLTKPIDTRTLISTLARFIEAAAPIAKPEQPQIDHHAN